MILCCCGSVFRSPDTKYVLHQQADHADCGPTAKAHKYGFSTGFHQLDNVGVQADRGVKFGYRENNSTGDYSVNRESEMPSCLVELGFMENEIDNQMFDQHLEQYAKAIATAIMDTFDLKDKKK